MNALLDLSVIAAYFNFSWLVVITILGDQSTD